MRATEDPVVCLAILGAFLLILGVGGIVADYVLPRIPFLKRYIDSLPGYEDDNEIAARYEEKFRTKTSRQRNRIYATIRKFLG